MLYFVYLLYSPRHKRTYVGQTKDIGLRLQRHNLRKVKSTKPYCPWILIHWESYTTRSEAMQREKWFKSHGGRRFISNLISNAETGGLSDTAFAGVEISSTKSGD
ncbi:MAG: GIY-YIG nuclease family protein [Ignavibacteria bacterium]